MREIDTILINAILEKEKSLCPGALDMIAVYGSAYTGDLHEKSDLDLLILINRDEGYQLSKSFILSDLDIGYDLYCTTWDSLREDAGCPMPI